jgi:hypothetical protein
MPKCAFFFSLWVLKKQQLSAPVDIFMTLCRVRLRNWFRFGVFLIRALAHCFLIKSVAKSQSTCQQKGVCMYAGEFGLWMHLSYDRSIDGMAVILGGRFIWQLEARF